MTSLTIFFDLIFVFYYGMRAIGLLGVKSWRWFLVLIGVIKLPEKEIARPSPLEDQEDKLKRLYGMDNEEVKEI